MTLKNLHIAFEVKQTLLGSYWAFFVVNGVLGVSVCQVKNKLYILKCFINAVFLAVFEFICLKCT